VSLNGVVADSEMKYYKSNTATATVTAWITNIHTEVFSNVFN
jgi:hypothetical protein